MNTSWLIDFKNEEPCNQSGQIASQAAYETSYNKKFFSDGSLPASFGRLRRL